MNGMGKQAAFFRGYLPDDRSLVPLTVLLSTTVALWLVVYLVAAVAGGPPRRGRWARRLRNLLRDRPAASSSIRLDASAQVSHFIAWAMSWRG